jgi:ABC-2 type transport system permease protein
MDLLNTPSTNFLPAFLNKKNLIAGICIFIVASIFLYVFVFGVNVLYLDEWSFVPLIKKYQSSGLSFELLFKQHNEHRIFFPRLLYVIAFPITHMNSLVFMYFDACLLCVEFACLYHIAKKQFNFTFSNIPAVLIIIPLFIFNFRQSQNIIWAFQEVFYMILIFVVLSLFFIEKALSQATNGKKIIYFSLAVITAIIATFSGAPGIIVWVAGAFQVFINTLSSSRNKKIFSFVTWIVFAIPVLLIYNHGLHSTLAQDLMYGLHNPFTFIRFFFCLISLTSVHSLSIIALPIGIVLFSVSGFVLYKAYKNKRLEQNSFWIALYIYSVLFAILTTIGRCPIAFEYSDRARYTIFTSLMSVSTFMLFYDAYLHSSNEKENKLFAFFFYGLLFLGIELNAIGIVFGVQQKKEREEMKAITLNYKKAPLGPEIKKIVPWVDSNFVRMVNESVPFVDSNHYNVFAKKK